MCIRDRDKLFTNEEQENQNNGNGNAISDNEISETSAAESKVGPGLCKKMVAEKGDEDEDSLSDSEIPLSSLRWREKKNNVKKESGAAKRNSGSEEEKEEEDCNASPSKRSRTSSSSQSISSNLKESQEKECEDPTEKGLTSGAGKEREEGGGEKEEEETGLNEPSTSSGRSLRNRRLNLNSLSARKMTNQRRICEWQYCGVEMKPGESLEWHYHCLLYTSPSPRD